MQEMATGLQRKNAILRNELRHLKNHKKRPFDADYGRVNDSSNRTHRDRAERGR